jgi:hypothetical protein
MWGLLAPDGNARHSVHAANIPAASSLLKTSEAGWLDAIVAGGVITSPGNANQ